MANISFGGLGNGLDFGKVVELLVQVERQPIERLNQRKLNAQAKLTDFGLLGGRLNSLQAAASALRTKLSFDKTQVNVTSESIKTPLTATSSSSGAVGNFTVTVNQLASAHQIASKSETAVCNFGSQLTKRVPR